MTVDTHAETSLSVLVEHGLLTRDEADRALVAAQAAGVPVLGHIVQRGLVDRLDAARAFAQALGLDFVDMAESPVDPSAVARVPADHARRLGVLPYGWDGRRLLVATANPGDLIALDDLRVIARAPIVPVYALKRDLDDRIASVYRAESELGDIGAGLAAAGPDSELDDLTGGDADDAPVVRYVNLLISQAIDDRASDVHVEPTERDLRVRVRIDGVLHEIMRSPKRIQAGVISRLKIMADMDIAERRVPQDGRVSLTHNGAKVDLRVATLPTVWGEKVVLRILDNSTAMLGLSELGFSPANLATYSTAFTKPYGMILVTGPTGSGKSTTLYATLNIVSKPEIHVVTVEDPVEYRLPGIAQMQVNNKAGLTFATALRSILRADPDVVLIGEIRDRETALIAVEAALTGHLVLTTLHTNSASSALNRLVEMGVEPFLVASAVDAVIAQRLVRRLCYKCRQPYQIAPAEADAIGLPWDRVTPPTLYRPVGCSSCSRTGYRGRMALQEIMPVNEHVERLTVDRSSTDEITKAALAGGMVPLREDGWLKVLDGQTSVEEVLRVVA